MPSPPLARRALLAAAAGAALGAVGLAALADGSKAGFAPDPPPVAARKQWVFELTARGGKVSADKARAVTLDKPIETPRVFGRYALELWVGKQLLDRVRFNVPLLGAEVSEGNRKRLPRPSFDKNVSAKVKVQMADNPRAVYLLLVDRESGDAQRFDWPPASDGALKPWPTGQLSTNPDDFPDGGARVVATPVDDGGSPGKPGSAPKPPGGARPPVDAGKD